MTEYILLNRKFKQRRRWQEGHQFAYLAMKTVVLPLCASLFHIVHSTAIRVDAMTLLVVKWTTRALGDKFSRDYFYQVHSGRVISYFARGVSRNSRKMVPETRCISRWLPRSRRRRRRLPCLNSLMELFLRLFLHVVQHFARTLSKCRYSSCF